MTLLLPRTSETYFCDPVSLLSLINCSDSLTRTSLTGSTSVNWSKTKEFFSLLKWGTLCKSCVLRTEAHFTQILPVIVQLHSKPYIESKPKRSEKVKPRHGYLLFWKKKKENQININPKQTKNHPTLVITVWKCICIFKLFCVVHTPNFLQSDSVYCFPFVSPRSGFSIFSQKGTVFTQRWKLQNYINWFC